MYAFMRTLGQVIGVAVGGTVFQNVMGAKLGQLGLPVAIADDAEGYVEVLQSLAPTDPNRVAALVAYVAGFRGVFEVLTAVSAVGLVVSLMIRHFGLGHILESNFKLDRS